MRLHFADMCKSVFETTIRFLGGLLSAFELSGEKHPVLVEKAKEVADKMAFAFHTVRIPHLRETCYG